ncbi:MAG: hypothetical protein JNK53_03975 [Phycisphaerae bacterium]|nr:hypothetical protein [Phycisphaerae bacterium]
MMIFRPEGLLPPRGIHEEPPKDDGDGPGSRDGSGGRAAGMAAPERAPGGAA